jgi:hypothetical protein
MNKKIILGILMVIIALSASAQARFGIRGGITVGELRFDREFIGSDNRVGYCGGLLLDLNVPAIGVGFEVSAMYNHRNNRLTDDNQVYKRHYIDIPVYARYRLALQGLSHVFAPIIFTGPSFSILFSENAPSNYKNSKTFLSWDVGAGADLFNHLRLTATYGIGISKAMSVINSEYTGRNVSGKDRHWTINAAYLF